MCKNPLETLYFSQHSLKQFQSCPLKFKKKYIEGIYWKMDKLVKPEAFRSLELGRVFHLLAERYFLGIPTGIEDIGEAGELVQWLHRLKAFMPMEEGAVYYPELEIKGLLGNYKLQGKYDLVVVRSDGIIQIYDWKTETAPIARRPMDGNLQTKLYLYLLSQSAGPLFHQKPNPEALEMIYWQPNFPENPVRIHYSKDRFKKDRDELEKLLEKIYQFDYGGYDKLWTPETICKSCEYLCLCHRKKMNYQEVHQELWADELEQDNLTGCARFSEIAL